MDSNTSSFANYSRDGVKMRVMVQPDNVQVKRVGRASIIEPGIKLLLECDSSKTLVINAYLKVQGSDNRSKNIPLQRSDEITFNTSHRTESIIMKLRFIKTLKVQMLKRNLGVSRPEGCIVFEAVNRDSNEVEAVTCTTDFAIISDPRYLDEVKKKRASMEVNTPTPKIGYYADDDYEPAKPRPIKRKYSRMQDVYVPRLKFEKDDPEYLPVKHVLANGGIVQADDPCTSSDWSSPDLGSPLSTSVLLPDTSEISLPRKSRKHDYLPSFTPNLRCSQDSLCSEVADSDEEEFRLAKLIEGLKKYHHHIVGCRRMSSAA